MGQLRKTNGPYFPSLRLRTAPIRRTSRIVEQEQDLTPNRSVEEFSYFTLRKEASDNHTAASLFGIACTRQLESSSLKNRPADVTRSTVQKALVVISDRPQQFGHLREKLSIVTKAWFAQRDFTDSTILDDFQEDLTRSFKETDDARDQFFGLSLREMIYEFKYQTLVLFKCLLLQPKVRR
jgi:transport protein Avl9